MIFHVLGSWALADSQRLEQTKFVISLTGYISRSRYREDLDLGSIHDYAEYRDILL